MGLAELNQIVVGTPYGCLRCRSFKRRPEEERWDREFLDKCVGVPWLPIPREGSSGVERLNIHLAPALDPSTVRATPAAGESRAPSRMSIRRNKELRLYGYTPGCPGCDAAIRGTAIAINHSQACRERIEAAVAAAATSQQSTGGPGASTEPAAAPSASASAPVVAPVAARPVHEPPARAEQEEPARQRPRFSELVGPEQAALAELFTELDAFCGTHHHGLETRPNYSEFELMSSYVHDLRHGYDLALQQDRERCSKAIDTQKPWLIVGGIYGGVAETQQQQYLNEVNHLAFCTRVYEEQTAKGKFFLHENPYERHLLGRRTFTASLAHTQCSDDSHRPVLF